MKDKDKVAHSVVWSIPGQTAGITERQQSADYEGMRLCVGDNRLKLMPGNKHQFLTPDSETPWSVSRTATPEELATNLHQHKPSPSLIVVGSGFASSQEDGRRIAEECARTEARRAAADAPLTDGERKMIEAYIQAALWSSSDESRPDGGDPLDRNYTSGDFDVVSLGKIREECRAFLRANHEHVGLRFEDAGHDFWLTRCGHGAGFWDGDWPEPAATILTEASKEAGERSIVVCKKRRGGTYLSYEGA